MRVKEYVAQDGSIPFKKWFDGLSSLAAAKISTALVRIELGNTPRTSNGSPVLECMSLIGDQDTASIFSRKDLIVLLGGGTKSR